MATQKVPVYDDNPDTRMFRQPHALKKRGEPKMLKVKLANGKSMEVRRPTIIRTKRLDGLTLNREVVRALGRLEARNRDFRKSNAHQLRLKI